LSISPEAAAASDGWSHLLQHLHQCLQCLFNLCHQHVVVKKLMMRLTAEQVNNVGSKNLGAGVTIVRSNKHASKV